MGVVLYYTGHRLAVRPNVHIIRFKRVPFEPLEYIIIYVCDQKDTR